MTAAVRHRILFVVALIALAMMTLANRAAASPQILGIVASNGQATPLICDHGRSCRARFSAFCLQQDRPAPSQGTSYRLADTQSLIRVVTHPDGHVERRPIGDLVQFQSRFGFTSVDVVLPPSVGSSGAVASLALEIGPAATLLPVEAADDPDPQTAGEIAVATGPLRAAAARLFDQPSPAADAARLATEAINALPPVHSESRLGLDQLWADILAAGKATGASDAGIAQANDMWQSCELAVASRMRLSMRECMEMRHTELMARTNRQFWDETGGS
jgi:hypothetical protein